MHGLRIILLSGLLLSASLLLIGSGGGGEGDGGFGTAPACPVGIEKDEVFEIMEIVYFWNDEPDQQSKYLNLDLAGFSDGNDLLDFLRFRPDRFDRQFTFITTVAEEEQFFNNGEVAAFGIGIQEEPGEVLITDVFAGSPASATSLARGDRILSIDQRSLDTIQAAEGLSAALGPSEAGVLRTFVIEKPSGEIDTLQLTKAVFPIDPVPDARIRTFQAAGRTVGYLQLRSFVRPAEAELRSAFVELGAAGIQDIVVDLRYNGGGLIRTARVLGSLLAGPGSSGRIFSELRYNRELSAAGWDETYLFQSEAAGLSLENLIFITTDASASASELVINGLAPYQDELGFRVLIVGSDTSGKPVGQDGFDYCDDPETGVPSQRLRAVTFSSVNVLGQGDYFDGLPVDCEAPDDLGNPLGDQNEASLAAALALIETGVCQDVTMQGNIPVGIELRRPQQAGSTASRLAGVW